MFYQTRQLLYNKALIFFLISTYLNTHSKQLFHHKNLPSFKEVQHYDRQNLSLSKQHSFDVFVYSSL